MPQALLLIAMPRRAQPRQQRRRPGRSDGEWVTERQQTGLQRQRLLVVLPTIHHVVLVPLMFTTTTTTTTTT